MNVQPDNWQVTQLEGLIMKNYRVTLRLYRNNMIVGRMWSGYGFPTQDDFDDGQIVMFEEC